MNIETVEKHIKENDAVMIYFSGENCAVCKDLMPKIKTTFNHNFPKIKQLYITASDFPKTSAHYSIFTVPSILVFFEAKETKRESRHISVDNLTLSTKRLYNMFFN